MILPQAGSEVMITLEITATVPDGIPDNIARTVSENGNTLRFTNLRFEAQ